jgi:putative transposase
LKANSSGWVHREFFDKGAFAWQTGFAAFTVSHSQKQSVLNYIASQEEHHRKLSFKEELVAFLEKHEIGYDEKYLWE